jgi:hypothetical protein
MMIDLTTLYKTMEHTDEIVEKETFQILGRVPMDLTE